MEHIDVSNQSLAAQEVEIYRFVIRTTDLKDPVFTIKINVFVIYIHFISLCFLYCVYRVFSIVIISHVVLPPCSDFKSHVFLPFSTENFLFRRNSFSNTCFIIIVTTLQACKLSQIAFNIQKKTSKVA